MQVCKEGEGKKLQCSWSVFLTSNLFSKNFTVISVEYFIKIWAAILFRLSAWKKWPYRIKSYFQALNIPDFFFFGSWSWMSSILKHCKTKSGLFDWETMERIDLVILSRFSSWVVSCHEISQPNQVNN